MNDKGSDSKRGFLMPGHLIEKARKFGLSLAELQNIVKLSTRVTHELGNRRYHDYYFMVEGNRVVNVSKLEKEVEFKQPLPSGGYTKRIECTFCNDKKVIRTFDECPHCEGVGCKRCDQGLTPSSIPCPMCVQRAAFSKRIV